MQDPLQLHQCSARNPPPPNNHYTEPPPLVSTLTSPSSSRSQTCLILHPTMMQVPGSCLHLTTTAVPSRHFFCLFLHPFSCFVRFRRRSTSASTWKTSTRAPSRTRSTSTWRSGRWQSSTVRTFYPLVFKSLVANPRICTPARACVAPSYFSVEAVVCFMCFAFLHLPLRRVFV